MTARHYETATWASGIPKSHASMYGSCSRFTLFFGASQDNVIGIIVFRDPAQKSLVTQTASRFAARRLSLTPNCLTNPGLHVALWAFDQRRGCLRWPQDLPIASDLLPKETLSHKGDVIYQQIQEAVPLQTSRGTITSGRCLVLAYAKLDMERLWPRTTLTPRGVFTGFFFSFSFSSFHVKPSYGKRRCLLHEHKTGFTSSATTPCQVSTLELCLPISDGILSPSDCYLDAAPDGALLR